MNIAVSSHGTGCVSDSMFALEIFCHALTLLRLCKEMVSMELLSKKVFGCLGRRLLIELIA